MLVTKYILHGGFTRAINEMNRSFYEEIGRSVPDGGTILLCYFASPETEDEQKLDDDRQKIADQAQGKSFKFLLATENDFMQQVKQSDAIYIRGGSTPKLLGILKRYPDFRNCLARKTVAGSSAGAYAIGLYSPFHDDESGGVVREGLGLLPLRIVCHFESPDLPPNPKALLLLQNTASELELVLLRDCEWRVFEA